MIQHENSALMDRILDRMERPLRDVFVAHELQQMTVSEISEALSLPIKTVQVRIRTARQDFEAFVEQHRAEQRRRGALVLPITAAALIASERARAVQFAEELSARMMNRLERIAEEEAEPLLGAGPHREAMPCARDAGSSGRSLPRPEPDKPPDIAGAADHTAARPPPIAVRRGLTGLDMYMKRVGDAEARRISMVAGAGIFLAGALLGGAVVFVLT